MLAVCGTVINQQVRDHPLSANPNWSEITR